MHRAFRLVASTVSAVLLLLAGAAAVSSPADAQGPVRSRWWDDVEAVGDRIAEGRWRRAGRELDRLREEVLRTSWREPDLGEVLAELAFQAAVIAAHRGREAEAVWEWHVALNHDRAHGRGRMAERDLAAYGEAGELLAAHPLRRKGEPPPGAEALPGPGRGHRGPEQPAFETRPLANDIALREAPASVLIEVLVGTDGTLRQPVVLSPWSHPVVIQWGLDNLRVMPPFRPARADGEPVPALQEVELELARTGRRW